MRCKTIHDVAEAITTDPSTGAWRSPRISSSENRTAAIGVLNAAAKRRGAADRNQRFHVLRTRVQIAAPTPRQSPRRFEPRDPRGRERCRWPATRYSRKTFPTRSARRYSRCRGTTRTWFAGCRCRAPGESIETEDIRWPERRQWGSKRAATPRTARRVHARGESPGEENKRDHH